jgi:hypothetical protein
MNKIVLFTIAFLFIPSITLASPQSSTNESLEISLLPPSFSWRNINGTDFTTSIKNQAPAPTCEAYALVAALDTIVQYNVGYPFDCDLSEAHLFFYPGGTCEWGVDIKDAANYLVDYGVPDEGCFPDPHRPHDTPFESLPEWENRTVKITDWGWVPNEENAIKQALIDHGPLVICMLVRPDFSYYRGGIYTPRWGEVTGGHVITIVGYNDSQHCYLIKNSWGPGWGEDGWIRVDYDAHTEEQPFIWPFYGGTGILYVDGVYGNFQPDVPRITVVEPARHHTFFMGYKFKSVLKHLPNVPAGGPPRIFSYAQTEINTTDVEYVEFYIDQELQGTDSEPPYQFMVTESRGLHTLEVFAYDINGNVSKGIRDFYILNKFF